MKGFQLQPQSHCFGTGFSLAAGLGGVSNNGDIIPCGLGASCLGDNRGKTEEQSEAPY